MNKKQLKEQRNKLEKTKNLLMKKDIEQRSAKEQKTIDELEDQVRAINEQLGSFDKNLEKREVKTNMDKNLEQRKAVSDYIKHREVRDLTSVNGGIVIPTQLHSEIVEKLDEVAPLFGRIEKLTPVAGNLEILREENLGSAGFVGENEDLKIEDFDFTKIKLEQRRCGSAIKLTNKLVNDAGIDIVDYANTLLVRRLAKALDKSIIKGSVEDEQFEGLESKMDDFEKVTQASSETIMIDDFMNVLNAMHLDYQGGACWVVSRTIFNKLCMLKDAMGNYYLTRDIINGKPAYKLLGCEVVVSEELEGVDCTAFLVNFSEAYAGMIKKDSELKRINADTNNALRGTELLVLDIYADVRVKNEKAVKVLKAVV